LPQAYPQHWDTKTTLASAARRECGKSALQDKHPKTVVQSFSISEPFRLPCQSKVFKTHLQASTMTMSSISMSFTDAVDVGHVG
jgi:hypothetical protein